MYSLLIAAAAFLSTLFGGLLALKLRDKLHLILGFSAGAVIGVAFFDLLPEAIVFGEKFHSPAVISVASRRWDSCPTWCWTESCCFTATPRLAVAFAAGVLCLHSLLDGVAIGLAFQASHQVGIVVAIAVLTHDFSDGINTMNIVLKNRGDRSQALSLAARSMRWLRCSESLRPISLPCPATASAPRWRCSPDSFSTSAPAISSRRATTRIRSFSPPLMTLAGAAVLYLAIALIG